MILTHRFSSDLIDGVHIKEGSNQSILYRQVLELFDPKIPTYHLVGNHELFNFNRSTINSLFHDWDRHGKYDDPYPNDPYWYYSFYAAEGIKVIALDCFEVSTIGQNDEGKNYLEAVELMVKYKGHNVSWIGDGDLIGLERRYQKVNGGISEKQLAWLERELTDSDTKREKVIMISHCCIDPGSCNLSCLLWNYDLVIETFARHPSIVVHMAGHSHVASHRLDDKTGIHYVVFHGVIESKPETHLTLFDTLLEIEGKGNELSLSLPLIDRYAMVSN